MEGKCRNNKPDEGRRGDVYDDVDAQRSVALCSLALSTSNVEVGVGKSSQSLLF